MSIIYSEAEAALLEAHRMTRALSRRYRHAIDQLLPDGRQDRQLKDRVQALETQAERLEAIIHQHKLLPHDADTELTDLKALGDSFVSWIDAAAADHLLANFANEEAALAEELEKAREAGVGGLDSAITAAREAAVGR
jgi:hypothetical protein